MIFKYFRRLIVRVGAVLVVAGMSFVVKGAVNVVEHHNHSTRDGLYVDPAFTKTAAAGLKRDLSFDGTVSGNVYAQPLYIENGPGGKAMIIVVTESDNVYALNAADGSIIWQDNVGAAVSASDLPCGNINPLGITGTPIVDLASRSLFFDAMTSPDGGNTKKHLIYSLNVDTGATNSGWPVDVGATAQFGSIKFTNSVQNERGALGILNGNLYVPYGGHFGDCGNYHGWLVSVALNNPASVSAWCTASTGGGSWSVGGVASDGLNVFSATGNTFNANNWSGGEAIIRFQAGAAFSGSTSDFWAAPNWSTLDSGDKDIGGSGPLIVDVPGATPSQLVVALGKDGNVYLLDRNNLGGINTPVAQAAVNSGAIIQAAATYRTALGTYVVFATGNSSQSLTALRIGATSPPSITTAWTKSEGGRGSPFVTSTDGSNNVVVWGIGAGNNERLLGFDGDNGTPVYTGGGANELLTFVRALNTGIAARGRIYVANDNKVFAYTVPVPPIVLTNSTALPDGTFQFGFTNTPGMGFSAYGSTDVTLPFSNWLWLGTLTDNPPGQFLFTDPQAGATNAQRFYRVRSP